MRRLTIFIWLIVCPLLAYAQNIAQEPSDAVDMTYAGSPAVDSTLIGRGIFEVLKTGQPGRNGVIKVMQSTAVARAMENHIVANASRKINGYRVRIFFDNGQNARAKSEGVMSEFTARHPGVGVYRDYQNPYFRVTVGDFRTKRDAFRFLNSIRSHYPAGFIVKEEIRYPML